MSQPTRPRDRVSGHRRRPLLKVGALETLESRALLAPVLSTTSTAATFTAVTLTPPNPLVSTGTIAFTRTASATSAAPVTSVSLLTSLTSFGGDMVRIQAGPGGDFGKAVYAISRGAGSNPTAVNLPGLIYRVDPATGKASTFFDLGPIIKKLEGPAATAGTSLGAGTGYTNWYDIAFDPEGYFDGRPSMFVTSADRSNPNKNAVFRIGSNGDFLGYYISFTAGQATGTLERSPTAAFVPPPELQKFFRGLFVGDGSQNAVGSSPVLFFDANVFRPGTDLSSGTTLPAGVTTTLLFNGPQTGLTSVNIDYSTGTVGNTFLGGSSVYGTFTNFGTPPAPGVPAVPGLSGVQGINGDFLINRGVFPAVGSTAIDTYPIITSDFRRLQDIAFDDYGYFSYGFPATLAGNVVSFPSASLQAPVYAGSVFVSDLAQGLAVSVPRPAGAPAGPAILVPVGGPLFPTGQPQGSVTVTFDPATGLFTVINTTFPSTAGGRITRIDTAGVMTNFAEGFNVSGANDFTSFNDSTLAITFSADGTTLYASDNDGIWQFKTVTSLAGSTTGNQIGLNDLRALGVPYEGQDSAVAILDTGVDANTPNFRGRVTTGTSTLTNGVGNDDLAPGSSTLIGDPDGHGTLVAGVVAQFVPQASLLPVNIFPVGSTNTNNNAFYYGLKYLARNPFVADPVRPNKQDRVIATTLGFGTDQTYDVEGSVYRQMGSPRMLTLAFKDQLTRMRRLGNQPIAASGNNGNGNGMSIPAIYNEVISVTGSYPFPLRQDAATPPTDPNAGVIPRPLGPVLLFPDLDQNIINAGNLQAFTAADNSVYYSDKLVATANKGITTDYAAPAVDVPTFRRSTAGVVGANVFYAAGTSLSTGIVAGSYATVASALDFWTQISRSGVTSDAYVNVPVGTRTLNFGAHQILDLSIYAQPDGINSILQWTAVPVENPNIPGYSTGNNRQLFNPGGKIRGGNRFPEYSRIDIGNAIASIEATIGLNYLIDRKMLNLLDTNGNGLVTAQSIQTFVDNSTTMGLPEAGAMARYLGGTARIAQPGVTFFNERPDSPDILQRRFNYLDYAVHGKLTGVISVEELRMLGHTLLPPPDSFVVVDRQRASANGYVLDPNPTRTYIDLRHLLPQYAFVPPGALKRFRGVTPNMFGINRGNIGGTGPYTYDLFGARAAKKGTPAAKPAVTAPAVAAPAVAQAQPKVTTPATPTPAPPQSTSGKSASTATPTTNPAPTTTPTREQAAKAFVDGLAALAKASSTGQPQMAGEIKDQAGATAPATTTPADTTTTKTPAVATTTKTVATKVDTAVKKTTNKVQTKKKILVTPKKQTTTEKFLDVLNPTKWFK